MRLRSFATGNRFFLCLARQVVLDNPECFLCSASLTLPIVWWRGSTGDLLLHAQCATRLSIRLLTDAEERHA